MKVSFELQPCLGNRSGIGIYEYELIKRLQNMKEIKYEGNLFGFFKSDDIKNSLADIFIDIHVCRYISYALYRRIWNYIPLRYNKIFNDYSDIYHFFNYIVPPNIKGKVITTIHDMTHELYPETMSKRNLKRIKNGIDYSIKRSDKIITVSESSKNDIIRLMNVPESKIEVVYNGVEYKRFHQKYSDEEEAKVRNKYNLPEDYILYMGTLEPRKNIESIIKSFELLKKQGKFSNVKLVIAGKKGWLFESIFNLVNKLNLESEVIFTDYVDEDDKPIIYNMAKLFVFPSLYEGFGIPVLEAMASSVPVITSNVSSLPEVAGDAAVLVEPKDIEGIAQMMERVLTDEKLRNNLIERGKIQAQKFTWEASAEKMCKIYKEVMNS